MQGQAWNLLFSSRRSGQPPNFSCFAGTHGCPLDKTDKTTQRNTSFRQDNATQDRQDNSKQNKTTQSKTKHDKMTQGKTSTTKQDKRSGKDGERQDRREGAVFFLCFHF